MQSSPLPAGLHVALILDGNGRWARARGLPRTAGHRRGAESAARVIDAAPALGIGVLTLYAFSADNWRRPPAEVEALMALFADFLAREVRRLVERGVRLNVIGRRDRLAAPLQRSIAGAERATRAGSSLVLRLAIDYSSRETLAAAACRFGNTRGRTEDFAARVLAACHSIPGVPPVDLVVRTGGERRLSDFLLFESAYAELYFTAVPWPDFGPAELAAALADYRRRERRFGGLEATELAS